jgi:hypothetical protein
MAGGLMQLVAYGAQDIYLTGNPQITFFKVVYRRHTNFAVESIEQTFNGAADLGRRFTCTIARNGDLLHRIYLQVDLDLSGTTPAAPVTALSYYGFQLLDYVEVEIGGQVIDKHYGEWMAVWCDLTHNFDQSRMLEYMVDPTNLGTALGTIADLNRLHIPLQFWFCRNPGLALPLIALQYHEVKINVQFEPLNAMTYQPLPVAGSYLQSCTIWADYIFLDTDERRRFAQVSHEYLIEQVQFSNALSIGQANATSSQHELRFNHPVKELIWLVDNSNNFSDFTSYIACSDALLQLNGQDRFKRRSGDYFIKVQRYEHHSGCGRALNSTDTTSTENENPVLSATHVYSFALKPEEHQPSGTCNFSRIDNAILNLSFSTSNTVAGNMNTTAVAASTVVKVYAVNYNVLRIMSGMGGLAYSN